MYDFLIFCMIVLLLGGGTFIFNGRFFEGYFLITSSLLIKLLDVDFIEYTFGEKITNTLKLTVIFIAVIFSGYMLFDDLKSQPFYINATTEQKSSYLKYEKFLFNQLYECTSIYNQAISQKSKNQTVSISQIAMIKETCGDVAIEINNYKLPDDDLEKNIIHLMQDLKIASKTITIAIKKYHYGGNDEYNQNLSSIIKTNQEDYTNKVEKLRYMLGLKSLKEENKKPVKINALDN